MYQHKQFHLWKMITDIRVVLSVVQETGGGGLQKSV